ncbi:uncharacterized [Tachysurus ichikawai]
MFLTRAGGDVERLSLSVSTFSKLEMSQSQKSCRGTARRRYCDVGGVCDRPSPLPDIMTLPVAVFFKERGGGERARRKKSMEIEKFGVAAARTVHLE